MKISAITLFNTKLDSLYQNVICPVTDNYTNHIDITSKYHDMLHNDINIFSGLLGSSKKRYTFGNPRGCVVNDDLSVIIKLEVIDSDINGYNYAEILDTENKYHYYFIEKFSRDNSLTRPLTVLLLKYDSWANSLDKIRISDIYGQLENGHIKRVDGIENNKPIFKNINIENGEQNYTYYPDFSSERYKVLYYKVIASEPKNEDKVFSVYSETINVKDINTSQTELFSITGRQIKSFFDYKYSASVFYIPVALIDTNDMSLVDTTTTFTTADITINFNNTQLFTTSVTTNKNPNYFFPKIYNSYIQDCYLTFYAPISYTISETLQSISVIFNCEGHRTADFSENPTGDLILGYVDVDGIRSDTSNEYMINNFFDNYFVDSEELHFKDINPFTGINSGTLNKEINAKLSTSYYSRPLSRYFLRVNDDIIDFPYMSKINDVNNDIKFIISYDSISPKLSITNSVPYPSSFQYIRKNQSVTYAIDAKDDYLIRNGSQFNIDKGIAKLNKISTLSNDVFGIGATIAGGVSQSINDTFGIISGIANAYITGGAKGIGNYLGNALTFQANMGKSLVNLVIDKYMGDLNIKKFDAKLSDLANTPSTPANSDFGQGDLLADLIYIIKGVQRNDITKDSIIHKEFRYGHNQSIFSNVNDIVNTYFDFKQFSNIDLNVYGIPDVCRKELQSIFRRGLTIHYIRENYKTDNAFIKGMSPTQIVNVDKEFRTDNNYKNAIGGITI